MIFQHSRFQIWNANQHPYKHSLDDFAYQNDAIPGVSTVQGILDYIVAVLYPQSQPAVATPGDLPMVGNTINDMRVVTDDGDGKAAAYRWEQREGEASASWHKIYDLDWGTDSILQAFLLKTQDIYVKQGGYDDLDETGTPIAGTLAGQRIYGGASASTNLTLFANSGDGVGAGTGFVQVGDQFRPTQDGVFDSGTSAMRWQKSWAYEGDFDGLLIQSGSITDATGAIDFGNENLSTTGTVLVGGSLLFAAGSITDSSGDIDFGDENLTTLGTVNCDLVNAPGSPSVFATGTSIADMVFTDSQIEVAAGSGFLTVLAADITVVGDLTAVNIFGSNTVTGGNVRLTGNSATTLSGALILNPTTVVDVQKSMSTLDQTVTGTLSVTGQFNADSLRIDGNILSATTANTDIKILPSGSGVILLGTTSRPDGDNVFSLGTAASRFTTLYLSTGISDGTTSIANSVLQSLRDINVGATAGMTLFFDGTKWAPSLPDSEIDHGTLSGLGDDDHTQYAFLTGRAGGQSLVGGTAASNNLDLESTSNGTKGAVQTKDTFRAFTDASYSGGWSGADLGGSGNRFRHLYTAGEAFGLRLENVGANPSASTQNVGRVVFNTSDSEVYVDTGTTFKKLSYSKFLSDTVWNGSDTSKTVTVSGDVDDARRAMWGLHDNTNDYDRIYCSIKAISATQVTITVGSALPAGSYRLIGIE